MSAVLEKINELPKGWAEAQLSDLSERITKGSTPTSYGYAYKTEGIKFIKAENIDATGHASTTSNYIDDETHEFLARSQLKENDLLFSIAGTIGRVGIVRDIDLPANTNQALAIIRLADKAIDIKYLYYYLNSPQIQTVALNKIVGVGRANLSLTNIGEFRVPLAPPEQQKRIVAKIEELFSHIDAGIEALKKAKQLLKQYRQSVLKAAVTGELLGNMFPSNIYKSIEYGLESLGQGWSPKCDKEPSQSEDVWGVIKTTAVQSLEYLQEENKRLPDKLEPRPQLEVKPGDILVTRAGPRVRVGVCCLVKETRKKLMICDKVYRLRTKANEILPEFLEIILNAPQVQDEIEELKTGISDSGVNLTQKRFIELQIPYPDIEEQQNIVDSVYEKADSVSRLENEINAQLGKAEKNKQSVLSTAFLGGI